MKLAAQGQLPGRAKGASKLKKNQGPAVKYEPPKYEPPVDSKKLALLGCAMIINILS